VASRCVPDCPSSLRVSQQPLSSLFLFDPPPHLLCKLSVFFGLLESLNTVKVTNLPQGQAGKSGLQREEGKEKQNYNPI
jgi:hypothetical protein